MPTCRKTEFNGLESAGYLSPKDETLLHQCIIYRYMRVHEIKHIFYNIKYFKYFIFMSNTCFIISFTQ